MTEVDGGLKSVVLFKVPRQAALKKCCFSRDWSVRVNPRGPGGGYSWQKEGQVQSPRWSIPGVFES